MSISRDEARQRECQVDAPELHKIVRAGLQTFLDSLKAEFFLVPLSITLHDSHGATLREFTVQRGGTIELGHSSDNAALYVFPLVAVAMDPTGRVGLLKITASGTEEVIQQLQLASEYLKECGRPGRELKSLCWLLRAARSWHCASPGFHARRSRCASTLPKTCCAKF
jgi:hypothetical protein